MLSYFIHDGSDCYISEDFPIVRSADVLLMKAEVLLHTGDEESALTLVNQIKTRAGLDNLTELSMEELLAERGRELYMEGHRRNDLIRFGVYSDAAVGKRSQ